MGILVVWIAPPIWSRSPAKPSKCSATASLSVNPWAANASTTHRKQGNWVRMKARMRAAGAKGCTLACEHSAAN